MHRLGKQDLPKIRPLKVEFSSRQEALSILVKRPKLPLKEFPNVNFKNDYPPRFREELTSMYKEIEQRRAHGENLRKICFRSADNSLRNHKKTSR
ncbi:hypothetical protein JTB14_009785 [Gonioctena quinquepunctata]|nr:hypothetical protein JTB14_009785 [Gonioctena quinquepunctata]